MFCINEQKLCILAAVECEIFKLIYNKNQHTEIHCYYD